MAIIRENATHAGHRSMLWTLVILCLAAIGSCHWLAELLSQRPEQEQARWASFGGGAGLAYVFIHLLPELASGGRTITEAVGTQTYLPTAMTESLLFLTTLVGVVIPYALSVITQQVPASRSWTGATRLGTFALINYLYAYSLPSLISTGLTYGLLFTVAISAHILLADRTMASEHPRVFRRRFRWIGSASLLLGALHAAVLHPVSDLTLAVATAFVGGSLLISVFREELPAPNVARLSWLLGGVVSMGALLLIATAHGLPAHHA